MRVVFLSYGTRGDTQPQVAMASALRDAGFAVRVAAPENLRGFVERAGLEYAPLHGNSQQIMLSETGQRWLRSGNLLAFVRELAALAREVNPKIYVDGLQAARDADLIVGGTLVEELSATLAEHLKVPFTFAHTIPLEATSAYASPLVTNARLPGVLNRATWALLRLGLWPVYRESITAFRKELGLPPPRGTVLTRAAERGLAAMQLWSPTLLAHAPDLPGNHHTVGFIQLPPAVRQRLGEGAPPAGLPEWLEAGPPPVYLGFGSMPMPEYDALMQDLAALADALRLRFVVCGGWNEVTHRADERIHVVRAVDHGWLFPRCAAVVHHGGAGTTAAATTAGVPSVVCSFVGDQPFWGTRLERLGAGAHLPIAKLNRASLQRALERVSTEACRQRARALGESLRGEEGLKTAVAVLTELAKQRPAKDSLSLRISAGSGPG